MTPREVTESFEQLGEELGLDGRCIVWTEQTSVTFEDPEGNQHHFEFATDPNLDWQS